MKNWKNVMEKHSNEITLLGIFIILFVIFSVASPDKFLTQTNLKTMMFQMPEFGLMAIAMMITILTGGIYYEWCSISKYCCGVCAGFSFCKRQSIAGSCSCISSVHGDFPIMWNGKWSDNSLHRSCTNVGNVGNKNII